MANVCNIQNNEGLRDPVKVYEYLNWFYVVEGNKESVYLNIWMSILFRVMLLV